MARLLVARLALVALAVGFAARAGGAPRGRRAAAARPQLPLPTPSPLDLPLVPSRPAMLPLQLATHDPQVIASGDSVVLAFEVAARNPNAIPLTVRATDYSVAVEGVSVFAGTAQQFSLPASGESQIAIGGLAEAEPARHMLPLLRGKRFRYSVRGTLHCQTAEGVAVDFPFAASDVAPASAEPAVAPPPAATLPAPPAPRESPYSLLSR